MICAVRGSERDDLRGYGMYVLIEMECFDSAALVTTCFFPALCFSQFISTLYLRHLSSLIAYLKFPSSSNFTNNLSIGFMNNAYPCIHSRSTLSGSGTQTTIQYRLHV